MNLAWMGLDTHWSLGPELLPLRPSPRSSVPLPAHSLAMCLGLTLGITCGTTDPGPRIDGLQVTLDRQLGLSRVLAVPDCWHQEEAGGPGDGVKGPTG